MPSTSREAGLVPVMNTHPKSHVRWYNPDEFEREFGYPPDDPAAIVRDEVLEELRRNSRLTLTEERLEAFDRISRLWNGEAVGPAGAHLLADEVLGDRPHRQDADQRLIR